MKESMGGIPILQIVIIFIILFAGIMGLTINHSKAFGVRDEIITIIESENANSLSDKLSNDTIEKIVDHLKEAGYRSTKHCPDNDYVGYDREGNETSGDAAFCIKAIDVSETYKRDINAKCKNGKCVVIDYSFPAMYYYDVVLFYELNIPALNQLMKFDMKGSTRIVFGKVS